MANNIDILDEHGQQTGRQASISAALTGGLWHAGAHVVVCSQDGHIIVQKRSAAMQMNPSLLDMSCGGFVDTGETPEQAAIRETKEELGITIAASQLRPLGTHYKNHAWPKQGIHDRAIIYCYQVVLDRRDITISVQQSEVEWARFVPLRQVKRLIRLHRLKNLGRIEPQYSFYRQLLKKIDQS